MTNKTNEALESGKAKVTSFGEKVKNEAGSVDLNNLDVNSLKEKKSLLAAVGGGLVLLVVLFSMLFGGGFDPEGTYSGPSDSSVTITSDEVVMSDGKGNSKALEISDVNPIDIKGFDYAYEFTMEDGSKMHLAQHESGKFTLGLLKKSGKLRGLKFTKD